ncbi:uracil-xanthine permease family protein [Desulfobotulus sp. H1]|uniref:Uracil-xanthine permease family protein n=1 Tax=Desulfobotulus pelophilus TaxID=2823377 RepID=A0ABT3N6S0_9BACT|nr:uracil-xanthine permease family protein [Desulfobotulus pelophilus]MCW7753155.1 uracil-xanthine permease family protein [Desulfobotulus pelophilus]
MQDQHDPTAYRFRGKDALLGGQMLFVAFGALVLVPLLTGLDPNVALFTAGAGTLIFQLVTRGKVPVFLASSFAFIAPISIGVAQWGIAATMGGLVAAGGVYVLFSFLIRWQGVAIVHRVLPPVVTGPVIMVIGLILAPIAVTMATGLANPDDVVPRGTALSVSMAALGTTVLVSLLGRGMFRLIPIVCGISVGYGLAMFHGLVDFTPVKEAPWFAIPSFTAPEFHLAAILFIIPVAIAPAIEHFGDVLAIGAITGKDYLEDPGIENTMLGDGLATSFASFLGGPPNTTYSEVTGAVALTGVNNAGVMTWAAISAIVLAFVGKLGALLSTIPAVVMGGIMLLLFGAIMVVGLNSLVRSGIDLMQNRNLAIVALILVFGIGGMSFSAGQFSLEGIGLAAILGIVLNLFLPRAR